jgi:uroporphyrinogen-III decarboxylase
MDGKTRIKLALSHREADRVPLFEAAFSSKLASQILGREVYLPSNGGASFRHFLEANRIGTQAAVRAATQAGCDAIELYAVLGIDMIRVRVTDFLTPVDFGYGNYGSNFLFDVEIQEVAENRWRIIGKEGFWSEHIFEPETDSIMCVDHAIAQGGIEAFRRWVGVLERQPLDVPPQAEPGLAGVRAAVAAAKEKGIFVLGWGDVAYPGSSPYLPLFLEAMITEPELIQRYMEVTTEGALRFVRAQLEAGVDGIIGGNDWCFKSGPMFSPANFRKFFVPCMRKIVDLCHSWGVPYIKHLDGNTTKLLPMLVSEVGIDAHHPLEPSAGMDIFALKKQYGDQITLCGNLECGELLSNGSPEQVVEQARRLIRDVAPGGGYIFSSSNSIHDQVKLENLYAMLDTVKSSGRYPIQL